MTLPVLYSFRRCPYAMRARLEISSSGIAVELREVVLRDKPSAFLAALPSATVPTLVPADGSVIDESLDIMLLALRRHGREGWLAPQNGSPEVMLALIEEIDGSFKTISTATSIMCATRTAIRCGSAPLLRRSCWSSMGVCPRPAGCSAIAPFSPIWRSFRLCGSLPTLIGHGPTAKAGLA